MKTTTKITIAVIINAILLLSIAYAAITNITLNIRGTVTADPSQANFKVKFTEPLSVSDSTKVTAAITDDTNATINVSGLTQKGEKVNATYTVHNISEDLSADLAVSTTNSNTEYFTISSKLAKTSLKAGEATTVNVTVELTKTPVTGSVNSTIGVQLIAAPVEPGKEGTSGNVNDFSQTPEGSGETPVVTPMYGDKVLTPTDQKYFTFTVNESTGTATITGINEEYAMKSYYQKGDKIEQDMYLNSAIYDDGVCITEVVIPYEYVDENNVRYPVTTIGNFAFGPKGDFAFNWGWSDDVGSYNAGNQTFISSFALPNTIQEIGEAAFACRGNLTNIEIPAGVEKIGKGAFMFCSSLDSISIPKSVTTIGDYAFAYNNLRNVELSNGLKTIGECTFRLCENLNNITIPESVVSIGDSAFERCSSLFEITIDSEAVATGLTTVSAQGNLAEYAGVVYVKNGIEVGEYVRGKLRLVTSNKDGYTQYAHI